MAKNPKEARVPQLNLVGVVIIAAVLGFISITSPPYIILGKKVVYYEDPLFPFIRTAIENLSLLPTTGLLILSGGIVGYLKPEKWGLLGFSTIVLFPLASITEMILYPTTHNLWPIEFFVYCILSIPAIVGALIGSKLKSIFIGR
jgi:hypothetical protein